MLGFRTISALRSSVGENCRVSSRVVGAELCEVLRRARQVEAAATTSAQRRRAVAATGALLLAAVQAGWSPAELARAVGLQDQTTRARIRRAKQRRDGASVGITVEPAPARHTRRTKTPLEQREWLRAGEAMQVAGVCYETLTQWRRAGLLPTARRTGRGNIQYAQIDLQRIATAPRRGKTGVQRRAVLEAIKADQSQIPTPRKV
jgi:MerR-like DNA binding protein